MKFLEVKDLLACTYQRNSDSCLGQTKPCRLLNLCIVDSLGLLLRQMYCIKGLQQKITNVIKNQANTHKDFVGKVGYFK